MDIKYIGSWELENTDEHLQFLEFARAYLAAAKLLCHRIEESIDTAKYADSCVITYNTYHAVELFLKGMILNKEKKAKLHHDVERLSEQYHQLYPEHDYIWNVPFVVEVIGDNSEANEMLEQKKKELPQEQIHRYPVNRNREMWQGAFAFEPKSFMNGVIIPLERDFSRLRKLIKA
jgi:HEPN domain-containing protein